MKKSQELSQLTLFEEDVEINNVEIEIEDNRPQQIEIVPYEVGDMVRIFNDANEENESEDFYYLKDLEKKRGIVEKVTHKPKLQYQVRFGENLAFVYHHELTI